LNPNCSGTKKGFTDAYQDYTGKIENAQNGTVFLDEIGNLPLQLQTKLLSLIQNRKLSRLGESKERVLDVRFIFATNENLKKAVAENRFRQDLYYRINTVEVQIPALRDRPEDIGLLAQYFLDRYKQKYHKPALELTEALQFGLTQFPWPGNIRELDHCLERSVILSNDHKLQLLIPQLEEQESTIVNLNIEEMEEVLIRKALRKHTEIFLWPQKIWDFHGLLYTGEWRNLDYRLILEDRFQMSDTRHQTSDIRLIVSTLVIEVAFTAIDCF
jgi:transcriptional regulator with PAS, ATPase and Fis domain